jgi:hypothetical protein
MEYFVITPVAALTASVPVGLVRVRAPAQPSGVTSLMVIASSLQYQPVPLAVNHLVPVMRKAAVMGNVRVPTLALEKGPGTVQLMMMMAEF